MTYPKVSLQKSTLKGQAFEPLSTNSSQGKQTKKEQLMDCFRLNGVKEKGFLTDEILDADDNLIEIQQKALDDIVNVNSLFTIAVFVGLALTSPGQQSLENRSDCDADIGVAKRLIIYEVVSFAFFLLSSLTAKTLKVQLHIHKFKIPISLMKYKLFRGFMLSLSFMASLLGIVCLTLSMVNAIQIRLGKLSCGSRSAIQAVTSLCAIVFVAIAIYLPSTLNVLWVLITTSKSGEKVKKATNSNP